MADVVTDALSDAQRVLHSMIDKHRAAAIPALAAAMMGWACEHGGTEALCATLSSTIDNSRILAGELKKSMS